MGYETYAGVVAREVDTGEADRYLTILTVERGKLECYAKGIRRQKSKNASQAGLLSYAEFQLYRSKDRYILTSAKAIEAFYGIRADVAKCAYAAHFLEIARDVIVEGQAFPQALQMLLNTLYALCYRDRSPEFLSRVFEIRMLALSGFAPFLDGCTVCGAPIPPGEAVFSIYGDGLVCGGAECRNGAGKAAPVSRGAVRAMKHVAECDAGAVFNFEINAQIQSELANLVPEYLSHKFGREYLKHGEAGRYGAFEREMLNLCKGRAPHDI